MVTTWLEAIYVQYEIPYNDCLPTYSSSYYFTVQPKLPMRAEGESFTSDKCHKSDWW
jgi:hypothetical protein